MKTVISHVCMYEYDVNKTKGTRRKTGKLGRNVLLKLNPRFFFLRFVVRSSEHIPRYLLGDLVATTAVEIRFYSDKNLVFKLTSPFRRSYRELCGEYVAGYSQSFFFTLLAEHHVVGDFKNIFLGR